MNSTFYVKFYFGNINDINTSCRLCIPAYMATPKVLEALAFSHMALFCTCDKYGCRQFNPWPKGIRPKYYEDFLRRHANDRFVLYQLKPTD